MAGYNSQSNLSGTSYEALLYCKTNIGGYFFDGFMKLSHTLETEVTKNPVETGASIVDHSYIKPPKLDIDIQMSDVNESLVQNQFSGGWSRSVTAWNILKKIQEDRIPFSVFTRLGRYDNMIITRLTSDDDSETISSLKAKVTLEQIPVARVRIVKVSAAPQTTQSTNLGQAEPEEDVSLLYAGLGDIFLSGFKKLKS